MKVVQAHPALVGEQHRSGFGLGLVRTPTAFFARPAFKEGHHA